MGRFGAGGWRLAEAAAAVVAVCRRSTNTVETVLRRAGMWQHLRPEQRECVGEVLARTLLAPGGAGEKAFIIEKWPGFGKTRSMTAVALALCALRYDEPMRMLVLAPNNLGPVWASRDEKDTAVPALRRVLGRTAAAQGHVGGGAPCGVVEEACGVRQCQHMLDKPRHFLQ